MEFSFFDKEKNKTVTFDAEIQPILLPVDFDAENMEELPSGAKRSHNATSGGVRDFYEENGELFYVITVIVVYSLSMVFLVGTMYRKKSRQRNVDKEVRRWVTQIYRQHTFR